MATAPTQAANGDCSPGGGATAEARLYIVRDEGIDIGIGTAGEIRDLIVQGILPATAVLVAAS